MDGKKLVNFIDKKHIVISLVLAILIVLSLLGTIIPYLKTPKGRVYDGMHGYSDDYIGYTSYIKEGMYGRNTFVIRSLPPPQGIFITHFIYIGLGKIANLFHIDAPAAYHFGRFVLGFTYIILLYLLMSRLLRNSWQALLGVVLTSVASTVGWYVYRGGQWIYNPLSSFGFVDNVNGRLTPRPHYLFGNILFLCCVLYFLLGLRSLRAKLFSFLCAILMGISHPTSGALLLMTVGVVSFLQLVLYRNAQYLKSSISLHIGGLIGLGISYYSIHQYPLSSILEFEGYVYNQMLPLSTIWSDIVSFGPIAWIGVPTLLFFSIFRSKEAKYQIMFFWIFIQLLLFFFFYQYFRAERFRFLQTSYFVPMGYGTILFLIYFTKRFWKGMLAFGFTLLLLVSVPTYIHGALENVYSMTDYKNYDVFVFPTRGQIEAFRFLDKYTTRESMVIASWEASNLILLYSHNYVIGNTQGWNSPAKEQMVAEKDAFFRGKYTQQEAKNYLHTKKIQYVYYGYQEKSIGNISHYPFLKEIFRNTDVTIYEVK